MLWVKAALEHEATAKCKGRHKGGGEGKKERKCETE
jgi:hypothetical protein